MTYTLAMAADKGIQIAKDGVSEVSMTDARALLTSLIRDVRWGRRVGAFTERGERRAYVVTPDFYDQATADSARLQGLQQYLEELAGQEQRPSVVHTLQVVREALAAADRHAAENIAKS